MPTKYFLRFIAAAAIILSNLNPSELKAQDRTLSVFADGAVASLNGQITKNTASEFSKLIAENRKLKLLVLNSPGGLVVPALKISEVVSTLGIATFVPENGICASACSIIFLSGNERVAKGKLGVHQFSNASSSSVQLILAEILDAFERYGVDRNISRHMLTTLPENMYFFNETEKADYKINRSRAEHLATEASIKVKARIDYTSYPPLALFNQNERITLPDFSGRDAWARSYRTRIRNGLSEGPNFAGHFNLIVIGCGMGCRFAYVANAKNGEVFKFPYGGEENLEMSLLYNLDSRLVKVTWIQDHDTCAQNDIVFNGRDFEVVAESTFTKTDLFCN